MKREGHEHVDALDVRPRELTAEQLAALVDGADRISSSTGPTLEQLVDRVPGLSAGERAALQLIAARPRSIREIAHTGARPTRRVRDDVASLERAGWIALEVTAAKSDDRIFALVHDFLARAERRAP